MAKTDWNREELILAFNLYCRTPFGRIHYRNPEIIALAKSIRRTPSAVSWKLANFASLDPLLKSRNIAGARHASKLDREIWDEFNGDWETLAFESAELMAKTIGRRTEEMPETDVFPIGRTREAVVRARVNQAFFRAAVLAAYDMRCCITGLSVTRLLTASHIVPWSVDPKNRTNPRNGLCLNALHDRALDCGLLTVTPDYVVRLSPLLKTRSGEVLPKFLSQCEGAKIRVPQRFAPDPALLRYHNEKIYLRS